MTGATEGVGVGLGTGIAEEPEFGAGARIEEVFEFIIVATILVFKIGLGSGVCI